MKMNKYLTALVIALFCAGLALAQLPPLVIQQTTNITYAHQWVAVPVYTNIALEPQRMLLTREQMGGVLSFLYANGVTPTNATTGQQLFVTTSNLGTGKFGFYFTNGVKVFYLDFKISATNN